MKRTITLFVILTLSLSFAVSAFAEDDHAVALESGPAATGPVPEIAPVSTTLGLAIQEIRQTAQAQAQELSLRLNQVAPGTPAAEELHRQIRQVKIDSEVAVLDAIIQDALEAGDEARMAEAEAARDRLVNPDQYQTPAIPSNRPAPSN